MLFKNVGIQSSKAVYLPGRKISKIWKPDLTLERTQASSSGSQGQ